MKRELIDRVRILRSKGRWDVHWRAGNSHARMRYGFAAPVWSRKKLYGILDADEEKIGNGVTWLWAQPWCLV